MSKKSALQGGLNAAIIIAATIAVAVLVNMLSSSLFGRADLTENGVNLLSDASKAAVEELEDLEIRVYISPNLPESIPVGPNRTMRIQSYPQKLRDKIEEYKSASAGNATVTYVTENVVEQGEKAKLKPFTGKGGAVGESGRFEFEKFVLGATFHYKNAMEVLDLALEPEFYEFEITKRLLRLKDKAEHSITMKDVLRAGEALNTAVQTCKTDIAEAIPEDDAQNPLAMLTGEGVDAKIAALKSAKPTLDTSCGGIPAALDALKALQGKSDVLERIVLITDAFVQSRDAIFGNLDKDEAKAQVAGELNRLLALGDAVDQEHDDLVDSPGRRRIGFVCDGVTFCPFPAPQPLIPNELKGALTQKNPILGQMLPQLERIEQQLQQTLAQINQGLFKGRGFDIVRVDLDDDIPSDVNALVVFGPKAAFSAYQLYQMDQFVLRGGSLAVFLNPWDVSILNYNSKGELKDPALARNGSNISELLASWGVTVTGDLLMEPTRHDDITLMSFLGRLIPFQPRLVQHPMMPVFTEFDTSDPLVRATSSITLPFPTTLTITEVPGVTAKKLVQSSADAVTTNDPAFPLEPTVTLDKIREQPGVGAKTVVATVSGELPSHFAGKDAPAAPEKADKTPEDDSPDPAKDAAKAAKVDKGSGRVLVIASNLGLEPLSNDAIFEGFNMGLISGEGMDYIEKFREYSANFQNWSTRVQQIQHTLQDNLQFMSNALDWSVQRDALVELRSKQYTRRPLEQLEDGQQTTYKLAAIAGAPALFLLCGLGYLLWRRKRRRGLSL